MTTATGKKDNLNIDNRHRKPLPDRADRPIRETISFRSATPTTHLDKFPGTTASPPTDSPSILPLRPPSVPGLTGLPEGQTKAKVASPGVRLSGIRLAVPDAR